jgi:hypothetical protein
MQNHRPEEDCSLWLACRMALQHHGCALQRRNASSAHCFYRGAGTIEIILRYVVVVEEEVEDQDLGPLLK